MIFINDFSNISPDEALMALAIMHNYAPQELKVGFTGILLDSLNESYFLFQFKNASGLCVSFSKKNG